MKRTVAVVVWLSAAAASAGTPPDDATLYSSVGWGQTVVPERASVTTQAGYDGSQQRAQATGFIEATLVPHLSVFAAVAYGEETAGTSRPAIGAAYQLLDPRQHAIGVRISGAYKPEGFSEPAGELETILALSHLFDRDVARTFVAYGSDADGHESDAELGAGYMHRVADHWAAGASMRYRYAIAAKTAGSAQWDMIGGGVGDLLLDRWRVEMLVGGGAVGASKVSTGPLALVSVGIDL